MKKIFGILITALLIFSIYNDLKNGTLPTSSVADANAAQAEQPATFFEMKIKPGDTVLSVVENQLKRPIPVSISKVIQDFQTLNPKQSPEKIHIGKTYKFPDYSKE